MGMDSVTAGIAAGGISGLSGLGSSAIESYAAEKVSDEEMKKRMQMQREQIAEQSREFDITSATGKEQFGKQFGLAERGQERGFGLQERSLDERKQAYLDSIKAGGANQGAAESSLMGSLGKENPELATQERDILTGNARGLADTSKAIRSELSSQGVRGGQAATILSRAFGEMGQGAQRDINRMRYEEVGGREAELRAYQAARARLGQSAYMGRA